MFCSEKRDVTDSPSEMRRMVSANRKATDSWRIFLQALAASVRGMVFVMTTSNSDKDKIEAYEYNVAGYIVKPISFDKFVSAVSTLNNFWQLCEQPE